MTGIAVGNRDVSACSAGAGEDGRITEADIDQAIRNIFGDCAEPPTTYGALAGDLYHIAYPTRLVSVMQAAAIVAALEDGGWMDEARLRGRLSQLLQEQGVESERIEQIVILGQREAENCDECVATCPGRCVQGPRGDCFCYEPLPPDPNRLSIAILFLENVEDEPMAFEADRVPCKDTLLHAGVNDGFSTANGIESATVSAGLLGLIQQSSGHPPASFDDATIDRLFGQAFTLPQGKCLNAAKVLLRARPISGNPAPGSRNDVLRLGFVNSASQLVGAQWAAYFGSGNTGLPVLLSQQWTPSNYPTPAGASFVLNLANLPGGTNLLPDLDAQRFLDVILQDDSSLDYADLVFRLCDCPTPTPTPSRTPTRTATSPPVSTRTPTPTSTIRSTPVKTGTPTVVPSITATNRPTPTATAATTATCIPPPPNMVAWWPLDDAAGSATVVDIGSPPADNGVAQSAPIQVLPPSAPGPATVPGNLFTNPPDRALFHYTQATYVEVPHSSALDLANSNLTIDAWVKPLPGPWSASRGDLHVYTVVDKLNLATNTGYAFYVQVQSSCPTCPPPPQQPPPGGAAATTEMRLAFVLGNGSGLVIYTSTPIYTGSGTIYPFPTPPSLLTPQPPSWTHVAVSVDRSLNAGKFYLNGNHLAASDFTAVAGLTNVAPLWIGGTRLYGTSHAPGFAEFTLNEIEVFDIALPQPDIQAIASAAGGKCKGMLAPTRTPTTTPTHTPTCVRPPPNMIAWWTADNTAADLSGNGYHGTFFQGSGTYTAGKVGAAFSLPTIPDFVQASPSLNFPGNFSIDAWIRTTNTGLAAVIDKRLNAGSNPVGYYLFVLGGALGFELGDGQPSLPHVSAGPNISDGNWHHVAATIDRASTTGGNLYVDGALVHTFDPTTRPGSIANAFSLRIGQAYVSAIAFQGAIDEVELFDRALLPQEVQDIFRAGSAGKCKTSLLTPSPTPTRTATAPATSTRTPTRTPNVPPID
jgi:hypothetical protein